MPWWVKAIGFIGVPSAIAIYLVVALVRGIVPALMDGNKLLIEHIGQMNSFVSGQQEIKNQNTDILRVLKTSCANSAKTEMDREKCLR